MCYRFVRGPLALKGEHVLLVLPSWRWPCINVFISSLLLFLFFSFSLFSFLFFSFSLFPFLFPFLSLFSSFSFSSLFLLFVGGPFMWGARGPGPPGPPP